MDNFLLTEYYLPMFMIAIEVLPNKVPKIAARGFRGKENWV